MIKMVHIRSVLIRNPETVVGEENTFSVDRNALSAWTWTAETIASVGCNGEIWEAAVA